MKMHKQHYLTVTFISEPIIQSNARGESNGNVMCLQTITSNGQIRSILTGQSIRWAIREGIAALKGDESVFRHHNEGGTATGYSYGPSRLPSMKDAVKELHKNKQTLADFADHVFGIMSVEKGESVTDMAKGQYSERSTILVSQGTSVTEFGYDSTFHQGVNPNEKKGTGQRAIYNTEHHFTRYLYRLTFDLNNTSKEDIETILHIVLAGLRIGGAHAANESELCPDSIMWCLYNIPGGSGVYLPGYQMQDATEEPDLTVFHKKAEDRGVNLRIVGLYKTEDGAVGPKYVHRKDVFGAILQDVDAFMQKD